MSRVGGDEAAGRSDASLPRIAVALVLGLVLGFSAPPRGSALPATFVALALALLADRLPERRRVARTAALGFAFGVGFAIVTMRWVVITVMRFGGLGRLAAEATYLGLVALEALPVAVGCGAYAALGRRSGALLAACLAVAFSYVPAFAPWRPIALALPLAPAAAWLGLGGGTLADFALMLPAASWVRSRERRASDLFVAIALALVVGAVGTWRVHALRETSRGLHRERIVAIRPATSIDEGTDPSLRRARLAFLAAATRRAEDLAPARIAWPESAHPFVLRRDEPSDLRAPNDTGILGSRATLLAGAMTESDGCHRWNGVVAFDGSGRRVGMVDKRVRVPFADFLPVLDLVSERSRCRDLRAAERTGLLVDRVGALVCYDEVVPGPARRSAADGAGYLVSFTNDAWFVGTDQPALHARVARMRAIETGLDLVRVVNVGRAEHVAPDGSVHERLSGEGPARLVVDVPVRPGSAPAVRLSPFVDGAFVLALIAAFASARQRRGSSSGGGGR